MSFLFTSVFLSALVAEKSTFSLAHRADNPAVFILVGVILVIAIIAIAATGRRRRRAGGVRRRRRREKVIIVR